LLLLLLFVHIWQADQRVRRLLLRRSKAVTAVDEVGVEKVMRR